MVSDKNDVTFYHEKNMNEYQEYDSRKLLGFLLDYHY